MRAREGSGNVPVRPQAKEALMLEGEKTIERKKKVRHYLNREYSCFLVKRDKARKYEMDLNFRLHSIILGIYLG